MSLPLKIFFATLASVIVVFAAFDLRLGFGAQSVDCIDAQVFITQLRAPSLIKKDDYIVFANTTGQKIMGSRFDGHLIVKKVGGMEGDTIKIAEQKLFINDVYIGKLDIADKAAKELGVPVNSFEKSILIPKGKLFLVGTKPHSFDSRYWGLVDHSLIVGSVYPVI